MNGILWHGRKWGPFFVRILPWHSSEQAATRTTKIPTRTFDPTGKFSKRILQNRSVDNNFVFWDWRSRKFVAHNQRFGAGHCFHFQGFCNIKREAEGFAERLLRSYKTTRCHSLEDSTRQSQRHMDVIFYIAAQTFSRLVGCSRRY